MTLELAHSTLLVDGNPAEALELLQSRVRQHPEDADFLASSAQGEPDAVKAILNY